MLVSLGRNESLSHQRLLRAAWYSYLAAFYFIPFLWRYFLRAALYDNDDDSADIRRFTAVITQDHPASEAGAR